MISRKATSAMATGCVSTSPGEKRREPARVIATMAAPLGTCSRVCGSSMAVRSMLKAVVPMKKMMSRNAMSAMVAVGMAGCSARREREMRTRGS